MDNKIERFLSRKPVRRMYFVMNWTCIDCQITVKLSQKNKHLKSEIHLNTDAIRDIDDTPTYYCIEPEPLPVSISFSASTRSNLTESPRLNSISLPQHELFFIFETICMVRVDKLVTIRTAII